MTEAINDARRAVIALLDALRPWLDDPVPRDVVIPAYDAAMAALAGALHEATTAKALGCVVRPMTTWHKGIEAKRRHD